MPCRGPEATAHNRIAVPVHVKIFHPYPKRDTAIFFPMIYTALYIMLLMRANPLSEMASSRQTSAIWAQKSR